MILHGDDPDATEETLQAVLNHLKKLFENRHAAEKANLQLVQLKYLNDSFRDYITELDRLMLLAGGIDWSDRHKITLVKNELNRRMRMAIIALQLPDDYEGWRDYLHRVAHNMDEMYRIDSINSASRGPQHQGVPRHANLAPTTPTTPIQDPNVMD
jgi:polyphosphate kinase 2 (PPK2 family)